MQQRFSTLRRIEATEQAAGDLPEVLRPLGAFEHLFWLIDQNHPVHFAMAAEIEGDASPRAWRQALDRLQQRHPLLGVSIHAAPGRAPDFHRGEPAPIPLRIIEDDDPSSRWTVEAGEELATPFDATRAPLLRALLIQGHREATVVLSAHHAVADGMSLAFAIRDLLHALVGGALKPLPLLLSQEAILGDTVVMAGSDADAPEPAGPAAILRPRDDARPKVLALPLSERLTARLSDRARQEGTVHAALLAAMGIAGSSIADAWQGIPVRLTSPVNTRRALGVGEDFGVFVGAASSTFQSGASEVGVTDFWTLAREAKSGVAFGQTREGGAVVSALQHAVATVPDVATAASFAAAAFAREGMVSNLGRLPFGRRFGPLRLKALWGPAVLQGLTGEQTFGVATLDGVLTLTHSSYTPHARLLGAMQSVLAEACAA